MDDSVSRVASDDSPEVAQLDGLPPNWPNESLKDPPKHTDSPSTPTATQPDPTVTSVAVDPSSPSPSGIEQPTDSVPPPTTAQTHESEPAISPQITEKPLPAEPAEPEHTDNPDDLKEHLAAVPPVATERKTSSRLLEDPGVKDLGWTDEAPRPAQLIRGLDNDDLFTLIRRFNKVSWFGVVFASSDILLSVPSLSGYAQSCLVHWTSSQSRCHA